MKTLNLVQGSDEWKKVRLEHFTASEAPAMMGASKYQSRDALLKLKATGISPEISEQQQRLFDKGHATEAAICPLFDTILGELYPVTGALEIAGLKLLASFDGLTADWDIGFEHKLWNERLAEACGVGELEPHYFWQLEQQLLISGAERIVFATSDGTDRNCVWMDYFPVAGRREQLIAGWKQFAIDLANYVLPESEEAKAIAEPIETLPSITYSTDFKSTGLELLSNIEAFKAAAMRLVDQSKKQLESDQDFANAEARIKSCKAAEEKIAVIQSNVIGEVSDIDKFVKDLGAISEMLRQCRLNEDKQVKARKEAIKHEEVARANNEFNAHTVGMNERLYVMAKVQMPTITSFDPLGAIKSLKTVASLRSKLNDEIARAKIQADAIYEKIVFNIDLLKMHAGEYGFLFSDIQNLVLKDSDYVTAIAQQRVTEHKAAEHARIQAEAQRIANEQIERDRFNAEKIAMREQAEAQAKTTLEAQLKAAQEAINKSPVFAPEIAPLREAQAQTPVYEAPSFLQAFDSVFSEPLVDISDFYVGKISAYAEIASLFFECKNSGRNFEREFSELYQRNKLPKKAA